jgi:hypothetical protein
VDTAKSSSVWRQQGDTHTHACTGSVVYLTYTACDEDVGEEVERLEIVPCRRYAEAPPKR